MSQTFTLPSIGAAHDSQGQYEYNRAVELWEALGKNQDTRPKKGEPEIMARLCDAHHDLLGGLLVLTAKMKHATTFAAVLAATEGSEYVVKLVELIASYQSDGRTICLVIDRVGDGTPDLVVSSPGTGWAVLADGSGKGDWEVQKFIGESARELRITTWKNLLTRIGRRSGGS